MSRTLGAYTLLSELGQGGMGTVWRGRHRSDAVAERQGGDVAIKVLRADLARRTEFQERFVREADLGVRLDHPNITKVFDLIQDGGTFALVMELVQGQELAARIGEVTGPIPWDRARPLFEQLAAAMTYAHAHGVIHRDMKPANVMVDDAGHLKVLDFGIAKQSGTNKTRTGVGMGTVDYMAPEQYTDAKNVDHRADIYALGMTLYEMVAGRLPWAKGTTEFEVLTVKNHGDLPAPTDFYPYIPAHVVDAIERATARQPDDRFDTVDALVLALAAPAPEPAAPEPAAPEPAAPEPAAPKPVDVPLVQKPAPPAQAPPAHAPAPTPDPPPKKRSTGLFVGLAFGGLALVCCGGVGGVWVMAEAEEAERLQRESESRALSAQAMAKLKSQKTDHGHNQSNALLEEAFDDANDALDLDWNNQDAHGVRALASVWMHQWHYNDFEWDQGLYKLDSALVETSGDSHPALLARAIFWDNVCEHAPSGSAEAKSGCAVAEAEWDTAWRALSGRGDWLEVEAAWNYASALNRRADDTSGSTRAAYWGTARTVCESQRGLLDVSPVNDRELAQECVMSTGVLEDYDAYYFWARALWAQDLADKGKLTSGTRTLVFRRGHVDCLGASVRPSSVWIPGEPDASAFCTHVGNLALGCESPSGANPYKPGSSLPWGKASRAERGATAACPL